MQKRLRNEIADHLTETEGEMRYDSVMSEMIYLNMVVSEILRLYPVLAVIDRECTIADSSEGYSLEPYGNFKIPQKMPVMIPLFGIHRDPKASF